MRWKGRQGSSNVEDRRRGNGKKVGAGIGVGTIIIFFLAVLLGEDPEKALQQIQSQPIEQTTSQPKSAEEEELAKFVSVVLKDTEDVWKKLFSEQLNRTYVEPSLVLFSGEDRSACGFASAATGPFYCPADQKIYIDLSFYEQLKTRFRAPGDFAMAYIVAHEVGHHVQHLLGITKEVTSQQRSMSKADANGLSVRLELQADFLAGVWAYHAQKMKNIIEKGDVEEAINAASSVGDDRIQMEARGYVVPDSFKHGTSKQRMKWFYKGLQNGNLREGDTFGVDI